MIKKRVITADVENVPQPFKDRHPPFSQCFFFFGKFSKSMLASAGNSLFIVMSKVIQTSWVIALDSFFKKSPQKEAR